MFAHLCLRRSLTQAGLQRNTGRDEGTLAASGGHKLSHASSGVKLHHRFVGVRHTMVIWVVINSKRLKSKMQSSHLHCTVLGLMN